MGFPGSILLSEKHIRKTTADKRHPLGTRGYTSDGRIFHYCKNGAVALAIGKLCQTPAAHAHFTDACTHATALTTLSTSVTLASTGSSITTANAFKDGYLMTKDAAGQGQLMMIESHPVTSTADTTCKFNLQEGSRLTAATTTGTTIWGVWHNLYYDVVVSPGTAPTGIIVGATTMAITASYYFWAQTWGPCLVEMTAAAAVVGYGMKSASDGTGTCVDGAIGATVDLPTVRPDIGVVWEVGASSDHGLVYLTISP